MANKIHTLLAIDIGSTSMKMAEFSFPNSGGIVLEKFAFEDFDVRDKNAQEVFAELYHNMLEKYEFNSKQVALTISGQSSFCRLTKLPRLEGKESAVAGIVAFEASQVVPYPMSEVVWDYQIMDNSELLAAEKAKKEAEAVEGAEEIAETEDEVRDIEGLIVAAKSKQIEGFANIIIDSGRDVVSVDIAPLAMYNAAMATHCSDNRCTILLNIGSHNTDMVIVDGKRIQVRSFRISGDTITQQISKEFGISFEEAEEMKRRLGFVALGGAYEEPDSEFAAKISKIARNIMTRLHGEISRTITDWRSRHGGSTPKRLLLAGGGALMNYTQEFFDEKLSMEVEFLNIFSALTIADSVDREEILNVAPMFSELVGMALKHLIVCPMDISLVPNSVKFLKEFSRKAIYFYASAALILICLLFFYSAVKFGSDGSRSLVTKTKEKVEETQAMQKKVQNLKRQNSAKLQEFEAANAWIEKRGEWLTVMVELQKALPDHMWIVALEGDGDSMVPKDPKANADMDMGFSFGGPDPAATAVVTTPKDDPTVRVDAALLTSVKELKVRMYSLIYDQNLLEDKLFAALKTSEYFSTDDDAFVIENYSGGTGDFNVNSYVVRLKLKNPIEK